MQVVTFYQSMHCAWELPVGFEAFASTTSSSSDDRATAEEGKVGDCRKFSRRQPHANRPAANVPSISLSSHHRYGAAHSFLYVAFEKTVTTSGSLPIPSHPISTAGDSEHLDTMTELAQSTDPRSPDATTPSVASWMSDMSSIPTSPAIHTDDMGVTSAGEAVEHGVYYLTDGNIIFQVRHF